MLLEEIFVCHIVNENGAHSIFRYFPWRISFGFRLCGVIYEMNSSFIITHMCVCVCLVVRVSSALHTYIRSFSNIYTMFFFYRTL